jgi:hypothetical protein
VSYDVTWHPEVKGDLEGLGEAELVRAALGLMNELRTDPYLGDELRERYNMKGLGDCRSIKFDRPDWTGKPRYRLVYENQPADGSPHEVRVYSVGPREKLRVYAKAVKRVSGEKRPTQRRRP